MVLALKQRDVLVHCDSRNTFGKTGKAVVVIHAHRKTMVKYMIHHQAPWKKTSYFYPYNNGVRAYSALSNKQIV